MSEPSPRGNEVDTRSVIQVSDLLYLYGGEFVEIKCIRLDYY